MLRGRTQTGTFGQNPVAASCLTPRGGAVTFGYRFLHFMRSSQPFRWGPGLWSRGVAGFNIRRGFNIRTRIMNSSAYESYHHTMRPLLAYLRRRFIRPVMPWHEHGKPGGRHQLGFTSQGWDARGRCRTLLRDEQRPFMVTCWSGRFLGLGLCFDEWLHPASGLHPTGNCHKRSMGRERFAAESFYTEQ